MPSVEASGICWGFTSDGLWAYILKIINWIALEIFNLNELIAHFHVFLFNPFRILCSFISMFLIRCSYALEILFFQEKFTHLTKDQNTQTEITKNNGNEEIN